MRRPPNAVLSIVLCPVIATSPNKNATPSVFGAAANAGKTSNAGNTETVDISLFK